MNQFRLAVSAQFRRPIAGSACFSGLRTPLPSFSRSLSTTRTRLAEPIAFSTNNTTEDNSISNIIAPKLDKERVVGRKNEQVVLWKLYALFNRHNTHLSLVAVVEDLDFMEKNEHLSYNEKVMYYMQLPHYPKLHISAGQLGFRKAQRAEYEAAYQVSSRMFKQMEEKAFLGPNDKLELILRDFGKGREAFLAALQGKEGSRVRPNIVRISDDTKLKFGGSRSKKLRRL